MSYSVTSLLSDSSYHRFTVDQCQSSRSLAKQKEHPQTSGQPVCRTSDLPADSEFVAEWVREIAWYKASGGGLHESIGSKGGEVEGVEVERADGRETRKRKKGEEEENNMPPKHSGCFDDGREELLLKQEEGTNKESWKTKKEVYILDEEEERSHSRLEAG
eukprot:GHVS01059786.1.p1 GENE.GHVS01059786.1~~GHVS01059786.1.p1  ORF type:complete len:161 (+),score=39.00 GHVS01059786.1:97-579(+)